MAATDARGAACRRAGAGERWGCDSWAVVSWRLNLDFTRRKPPFPADLTRAWNASIARHSHQRLVMDAKLRGLFARVQEPRIIEEIRAELADKLALHGVGGISERVE